MPFYITGNAKNNIKTFKQVVQFRKKQERDPLILKSLLTEDIKKTKRGSGRKIAVPKINQYVAF